MVDQAGPTVGRRRLAGELRRHRTHAGLTMRQVATHLDCSAGKISRLEAGLIAPNVSDVRIMLALYGVDDQERDTLIEVARRARERAWWHAYTDVLPPESATFFGLEDGAAAISEYSVQLIPGLFQTADYARVLMESAFATDPDVIARRLELRLRRQQLLDRPGAPHLHVVLYEALLYDTMGHPDIAAAQLTRIVEAAQRPTVTVQVLPFTADAHPAKGAPFTMLRFANPSDPEIVYLEHSRLNTYLEDEDDVSFYSQAFGRIAGLSYPLADSMNAITAAITRIRGDA